jgi:hypothetical protein
LHEVETDLWDGYYFLEHWPADLASDLKRYWDEKRPAFTHVVMFDHKPFGSGAIPENKYLPNVSDIKLLRGVSP